MEAMVKVMENMNDTYSTRTLGRFNSVFSLTYFLKKWEKGRIGYIEEHRSNFPFGDNFTKVGVLVDDKIPSTTSGIPPTLRVPTLRHMLSPPRGPTTGPHVTKHIL